VVDGKWLEAAVAAVSAQGVSGQVPRERATGGGGRGIIRAGCSGGWVALGAAA
jgi:hypothetical protein